MKTTITVLVSLFLLSAALGSEKYKFQLSNPSAESVQGDEISFTIFNESKEIGFFTGIGVEIRDKDGSWKRVRGDVRCPCNAKYNFGYPTKRIKKWNYSWDTAEETCDRPQAGAYRFVITGRWNEEIERNEYEGISVTFRIKQK